METLQHLPLIYRPAFRAALKTRSPSSLPCGITLTSHMRMRRENGYGGMDIYHAEHITIPSFRSIRLRTQTIFQPLFKARISGDFSFFFFFIWSNYLCSSDRSWMSAILTVIRMRSALWHACMNPDSSVQSPVLGVEWVCKSSVMRAGLSPGCMDHLGPPIT